MSDEQLDYTELPEHLRGGLREYIERGRIPGGFLMAVIQNDLTNAFGFGDTTFARVSAGSGYTGASLHCLVN